ncbi:peptidoglycan editing factor PgeF [Paenibacillus chungangensis]|uniref:Purine nucleoside phosphorylase n=1 Tax=Paenibacillus chungangensis TaxID=696535 RepID=A0ABW3HRZ1_9BACL
MEPFQASSSSLPSLFLIPAWKQVDSRLTAGFTGRQGGVSREPWNSNNMGLHVGDQADDVIRNRKLLAHSIGWSFEAWTCAEQVHGCEVRKVTREERGKGRTLHADAIQGADAIMTNERGVLLASYYADCVPLYFYDGENGAVALAHAGWRGTVASIASETVQAMREAYGTKPQSIRAAIGPSIGSCCYEVDGPVISAADAVMRELGFRHETAESCLDRLIGEKANINLKELNRQIMIKAGILPSHIEISKWCTSCRRDLFFSHRADGGRTGRMVSWIGLSER